LNLLPIEEILSDAPGLFKEGLFNEEEKNEILKKYLFHKYAFSKWKRYYLFWHYGSLIKELEKLSEKNRSKTFLEVGCGTGSTTIYYAKKASISLSVGIDIDALRLQIAKKRASWYNADCCEFIENNFLHIELSQSFDTIYSMAAFELIQPREDALKKMVSLTGKNGQIILDMANPYNRKSKSKYATKDDLKYISSFFKDNGFNININFQSVLTGIDPTNITTKVPYVNTFVRLHAFKKNFTIIDLPFTKP
jgi:ubiquinone/menaquinone biosynthesis C-methylase UbiE